MAYSFATGRGVQKDNKKAFDWSLKCAEQKDIECMFNVVGCYMQGRGTEKNLDSMVVWATRIALLNTPEDLNVSGQITSARVNLATMYHDGQNVPKNLAKSYMWFLIYKESKRDFPFLSNRKTLKLFKHWRSSFPQQTKKKQNLKRRNY